jgi:O-antigen/teichoic acid export membrane protein
MRAVDTRIKGTLASSAFGLGLSVFLTPILSRLYGPTEYGVFAALNGFATIMATLSLVSLPNALAISHSGSARRRLSVALLKLSSAGVVATFLLMAGLQLYSVPSARWVEPWSMIACPLLVLAICLSRIATSLSISLGAFRGQVQGRLAYAMLTRPLSVMFATLLPAKSWMMLVAEILGFLGQAVATIRDPARLLLRTGKRRWHPVRTWNEVCRHRNFSAFDYPTQLLVIATSIVPALIIAYRFGPKTAGLVTLALSLLTMPIQLVALAIAPALLFRIRQWATSDDGVAGRKLSLAFALLAAMAAAGYGLLSIIAPWFMPAFLGPSWTATSPIVIWFAFAFAVQFLMTPFEATYWFSGHTAAKLFISLGGFLLSIAVLTYSPAHDPLGAIRYWAWILAVQRLAELLLLIRARFVVRARAK